MDIDTASFELPEVRPLPEAVMTPEQIDTALRDGRVVSTEMEWKRFGIVFAAEPGMPTAVRVITVAHLYGR